MRWPSRVCSLALLLVFCGCYASHERPTIDETAPRAEGPWLAFTKRGGEVDELFAVRATDLAEVRLASGHIIRQARWSPTGRRLALSYRPLGGEHSASLEIVRFDDGGVADRRVVESGQPGFILQLEWSPDGRYLAYMVETPVEDGVRESSVRVLDATRSGEPRRLSEGDRRHVQLAWSPTSHALAFDSADDDGEQSLSIASVASGFVPRTVSLPSGIVQPELNVESTSADDYPYQGWSPDGSRLAFLAERGSPGYDPNRLFVANVAEDRARLVSPVMSSHRTAIFWTRWSSGSRYLLYSDESEPGHEIGSYVVRVDEDAASEPLRVATRPERAQWVGERRLVAISTDRDAHAASVTIEGDSTSTAELFSMERGCLQTAVFPDPLRIVLTCPDDDARNPDHVLVWQAGDASAHEVGRVDVARFTRRGWTRDGSMFAFVADDPDGSWILYELSFPDGSLQEVSRGVDRWSPIRPAPWSADERFYFVALSQDLDDGLAVRDRARDRFDVVVAPEEDVDVEVFGFEGVAPRR